MTGICRLDLSMLGYIVQTRILLYTEYRYL